MKQETTQVAKSLVESVRETFLQSATDGSATLTEQGLSQQHGVSRGSIREVMRHLEHQGLIERRRKTGSRLRKLSVKELVDLWDVRCALEALAARLACVHITEQDLQALRETIAARARAAERGDQKTVDKLDVEFHQRIVAVSRNTFIRDISRNLHVFDSVFGVTYPVPSYDPEAERQPYSHDKIIEALARRDADLAEDLLKRHILRGKKWRIEALIGKIDPFEVASEQARMGLALAEGLGPVPGQPNKPSLKS